MTMLSPRGCRCRSRGAFCCVELSRRRCCRRVFCRVESCRSSIQTRFVSKDFPARTKWRSNKVLVEKQSRVRRCFRCRRGSSGRGRVWKRKRSIFLWLLPRHFSIFGRFDFARKFRSHRFRHLENKSRRRRRRRVRSAFGRRRQFDRYALKSVSAVTVQSTTRQPSPRRPWVIRSAWWVSSLLVSRVSRSAAVLSHLSWRWLVGDWWSIFW